ncbi:MAG: Crp/Fnr family transcriptional regulator [Candidatus Geothermincolia bacterium]
MRVERADSSRLNVMWKIPMFNFMEANELDELYSLMAVTSYAQNEYIYSECEHPKKLFVVEQGTVKLLKQSEDGREIILDIAIPGDLFGEVALFDGKPYAETAQVLEDAVVLTLERSDFFSFLRKNPDITLEIITELGGMLRRYQDTIRALAAERVEWRIARILVNLAKRAGIAASDTLEINVPITRKDIADMAGTTVETAIRVISNFKRLGILDTQRRKIVVTDMKRLEAMVKEGCSAA